jgi:Na+/H+ antiporter NhaD/arsenite permease-like protein
MVIILIWQRGDLRRLKEKIGATSSEDLEGFLDEWAMVKDKKLFNGSVILFIAVIVSIALHHRLEMLLGIEPNTLLVAASITGAGLVMLWQRHQARDFIQKDVDWWTLIFFMFLFAKAGALKFLGLTDVIADSLSNLAVAGGVPLLIIMVLWISGFASAAMDNVVVVAALVPVLQNLSQQVGSPVLWWALLFGGTYGGNMTMVGSTANIVALGILETRKGHHMPLKYWIRIGLWGSLVPMVIGTLALLLFG